MYPKKKIPYPFEDKAQLCVYQQGRYYTAQRVDEAHNQCHDQMTQEIKKRADVERLAELIDDKIAEWEDALSAMNTPEPLEDYLAQAISTHITGGLEKGQLYKKPEKFIADEWREGKQGQL